MLEILLITIATTFGGGEGAERDAVVAAEGGAAKVSSASSAEAVPKAAPTAEPAYETEEQTPTGRFTKAVEVKPILNATRANWVALRDYNGQDLLYFTQVLSWRCGLVALHYSINGDALQRYELPPCHEDTNTPNAFLESDGLPYLSFARGSVETVIVEVTYDDGTTDRADFSRKRIMMP